VLNWGGNSQLPDHIVVLNQPEAVLGEVPVLFVVPAAVEAVFDVGALLTHCREHLSAFKLPADVHLVARIPRTASGKIQRFKLLEQLQPAAEVGTGGRG
jgi:acyl-CoA synthetase (AMP-forming)/AMP-acid ligase II